ncbi:type 2 periplasmic-binding domain-containing protein [Moraxella caprae]|uniref:hypothetical protein n=1 Tax=Moraxella caprae TaxID=90240 RepID=UPI0006855439|nr:hypothetical protein [Moraxella caprae]
MSNNILLLPSLLQESDLVAVLPKHLAQTLPNVRLQNPPINIDGFTIMMTWHERTEQDMAHRWLRGVVLDVIGGVEH